jgi:hypothetical protein
MALKYQISKVTSVKNTIKCFKHWQTAQRQNQESESEITMWDRMQMYNNMKNKVFQKERYNDIPNVTVWRVLRKLLCLKACKLSTFQHIERYFFFT